MTDELDASRGPAEPFEAYVERQFRNITRGLSQLRTDQREESETMATAQEAVDAALAGDQQAIQDLGNRVTATTTGLQETIQKLEATIQSKAGEGLNVTDLEAHLAELKQLADAIDPAPAPAPPGGGEGGGTGPGTE